MEKAREIQVKADEEFAIEKVSTRGGHREVHLTYVSRPVPLRLLQSKIVRQEAINIDSAHEKKIKQTKVSNKMLVEA